MLTVTRQGLVASAAVTADRPRSHPGRPPSYDKKVGLVLQGGGALGSYQAGVYEALAPSEYLPDWVAGISIGAINAAIIAGNPLENRLAFCVVSGMRSQPLPAFGHVRPLGRGPSGSKRQVR
jgi:predicted acylesterase/phospholipase RssA